MTVSTEKILSKCKEIHHEIIKIRRDIHRHPEIGFDVQRTAKIAVDELKNLKIETKEGIGKTGVVGDIIIPNVNKCIALRADMDALPMQELNDLDFRSTLDGKAHMCGHDAHTAMLIGASKVIHYFKDSLKKNVRFVFQPNEESLPGGASKMIEDGVLDGVDEIYGLHVWPLLEVGEIGLRSGPFLAQADFFEIKITGKGGHAAWPHKTIDPIVIASQFVTLVQSICSRNIDPTEAAVISITKFNAGSANNVIPESVTLGGTVRTFNKDIQLMIKQKIESTLKSLQNLHGIQYTFDYQEGHPVTFNHESCVLKVIEQAETLVDKEQVIYPFPLVMGGEDFGYYSDKIPAGFVALGCANKQKGIDKMLHHPQFEIDEECMIYGMALLSSLALRDE